MISYFLNSELKDFSFFNYEEQLASFAIIWGKQLLLCRGALHMFAIR